MLLSMMAIVELLGETCSKRFLGESSHIIEIGHAELYDPAAPLQKNAVYLADFSHFPQSDIVAEGHASLICLGSINALHQAQPKLNIVQAENVSLPQLLAKVQSIFQMYQKWDDRLKEIVLQHGTVADLLAASLPIFQSNILVHDTELKTIAYKTHATGKKRSPLDELTQDKVLSHDVLATFMRSARANCGDADPFTIREPHFWATSNGPYSLSMNVFSQETCIARIALTTYEEDTKPTEKDIGSLIVLCAYVKAVLDASFSHIMGDGKDAFSSLILDMIEGKSVSQSRLDAAGQNHQWNHHDDEYLLLAIAPSLAKTRRPSPTYPFIAIFSRISEMFPESHPFVVEEKGYVLLNMTRGKTKFESLSKTLERIALENDCIFGSGRAFRGVRHLKQAYHEACMTMECASEQLCRQMNRHLLHISDVSLQLADKFITDRIEPLTFCPKGLIHLIHYDNKHKSELYTTIRTYIECNCSPTRCAKVLFIQRSTFQYRFEKATHILDMDLGDPDNQLRLRLSFRLLDEIPLQEFKAI